MVSPPSTQVEGSLPRDRSTAAAQMRRGELALSTCVRAAISSAGMLVRVSVCGVERERSEAVQADGCLHEPE